MRTALLSLGIVSNYGLVFSQKIDSPNEVYLDAKKSSFNIIDYLDQTAPGSTPEIFAPGIVSVNGRYEYGLSVSPDGNEIYFTADSPGDGLTVIKKTDGIWTSPVIANLRGNNSWEFEAFYAVDGNTLFFTSDTDGNSRFWKVEKTDSGWSDAAYLESPINNSNVMWCTFTSDATMYYGDNSSLQIHRSRSVEGAYPEVENLGFNGTHPSVAPDESYFIFNSGRYGGYGRNDIFVVFRKADGSWHEPVNMGDKINTTFSETCASLSPDGKYIFFSRYDEVGGKSNIYWVSTSVIESLRASVVDLEIITEPADQWIRPDTSATLSVTVDGAISPNYQWYEGAAGDTTDPIDGALEAVFTTPTLSASKTYWVNVTEGDESVSSRTVLVEVKSHYWVWCYDHELPEQGYPFLSNPAGDGIPNGIKYACGLDPTEAIEMGTLLIPLRTDSGAWVIRYVMAKSHPGVSLVLYSSIDLTNWTIVDTEPALEDLGDTWLCTVPIPEDSTMHAYRLVATEV